MNCPLCGKKIPVESKLIGPHKVFQPIEGATGAEMEVCGQCFLLINIFQTLKEIRDVRVAPIIQGMNIVKGIKDGKLR